MSNQDAMYPKTDYSKFYRMTGDYQSPTSGEIAVGDIVTTEYRPDTPMLVVQVTSKRFFLVYPDESDKERGELVIEEHANVRLYAKRVSREEGE